MDTTDPATKAIPTVGTMKDTATEATDTGGTSKNTVMVITLPKNTNTDTTKSSIAITNPSAIANTTSNTARIASF